MQKGPETGARQLFHWSKGDIGRKQINPRFGHSVTLVGDALLLFGGYSSEYMSTLSYLFEGRMWRDIPCSGLVPRGRCGHCAFAYKGKLYIWSGDSGDNCLDDMWAFSLRTMCWERVLTTNNPTPRAWASCCVVGDWMIMAGGENRYQQGVRENSYNVFWDQWTLHLPTMTWYSMADESIITPCPRVGHSMVSVGNMVLAFGGAIPAEWCKTTGKNMGDVNPTISTGDRGVHDEQVPVMKTVMSQENLNIDTLKTDPSMNPQKLEVSSKTDVFESVEDRMNKLGQCSFEKYLVNDIWYFFVEEEQNEQSADKSPNTSQSEKKEIHPPKARWVKANFKAPMDVNQKPEEIKTAEVIPAPRAFQTMGTGAISKESKTDKLKTTITPVYIYGGMSVDGPVSDIWRLDIITREELETIKYGLNASSSSFNSIINGQKQDQKKHSPFSASVSVVSACFPGLSPVAYEETESKCIIAASVANISESNPRTKGYSRAPKSSSGRMTARKDLTRPNSSNTSDISASNAKIVSNESTVDTSSIIKTSPRTGSKVPNSNEKTRPVTGYSVIRGRPGSISTGVANTESSQVGLVSFDILAPRGRYSMAGTIVPAHLKPSRFQSGFSLYSKSRDGSVSRYGKSETSNPTASIFEKTKDRDILIVNGGVGEVEKAKKDAISYGEDRETTDMNSLARPYNLLCDTWYIKMPEDTKLAHLHSSVDDDVATTLKRNSMVTDIISAATESLTGLRDVIADEECSPCKQLEDAINGTKSSQCEDSRNPSTETEELHGQTMYSNESLIGMVNTIQAKLRDVEEYSAKSHIDAMKTINSLKRNLTVIAADGRKMGIKAKNLSRMIAAEYKDFAEKVEGISAQANECYITSKNKFSEYFSENSEMIEQMRDLQNKMENVLSEFEDNVNNAFKEFDLKIVQYNKRFSVCASYIENFDQHQRGLITAFFRKISQFQGAIEKIKESLEELFKNEEEQVDVELSRVTDELNKRVEILVSENEEDLKVVQSTRQEFMDRLGEFDGKIDEFNEATRKQIVEHDEKLRHMIDELRKAIFEDHKKQKSDFKVLIDNVQDIVNKKNQETDSVTSEINSMINNSNDNAKKATDDMNNHYKEGSEKLKSEFAQHTGEIQGKISEFDTKSEEYKTSIGNMVDGALSEAENEIHSHLEKETGERSAEVKDELVKKLEDIKAKILSSLDHTSTMVAESTDKINSTNTEVDDANNTYKSENERIEAKLSGMKNQLNEIKESLEKMTQELTERATSQGDHNKAYTEMLDSYLEKAKTDEETILPGFETKISENVSEFEVANEEALKEFENKKHNLEQVEAKLNELKVPKVSVQLAETAQKISEYLTSNTNEIDNNKQEVSGSIDNIDTNLTKFNDDKAKYLDDVKAFETTTTASVDESHAHAAGSEKNLGDVSVRCARAVEQERKIAEQEEFLKNNKEYHQDIENKLKSFAENIKKEDADLVTDHESKTEAIAPTIKEETQKALEEYKSETKVKSDELDQKGQSIGEIASKAEATKRASEEYTKEFDEKIAPEMKAKYDGLKEDIANYEADFNDTVAGLEAFVNRKLMKIKQLISNADEVVLKPSLDHRAGWIDEIKSYFEENKAKIEDTIDDADKRIKDSLVEQDVPTLLSIQSCVYQDIENSLRTVDSSISEINVRLHTFQEDLRRAKKATEPTSVISSRAFSSCDNLMKTLTEDTDTTSLLRLRNKGGDVSSVSARNSLKQVRGTGPTERDQHLAKAASNSPSTRM